MFGDKALELVKELKRSMDGTLPPYNVRYWFLLIQYIVFGGKLSFLVGLLSDQRTNKCFQSRLVNFACLYRNDLFVRVEFGEAPI